MDRKTVANQIVFRTSGSGGGGKAGITIFSSDINAAHRCARHKENIAFDSISALFQ